MIGSQVQTWRVNDRITHDQVAFRGGVYDSSMSLAEKLHPDRFTAMSPKMTAIVAYVLGEHWTDPEIQWMSVSSDGYHD